MQPQIWSALAGGLGGLIRAGLGIVKCKKENKAFKFSHADFWSTVIEGTVIGLVDGYTFQNPMTAFLMAWSGTDLADSLGMFHKK